MRISATTPMLRLVALFAFVESTRALAPVASAVNPMRSSRHTFAWLQPRLQHRQVATPTSIRSTELCMANRVPPSKSVQPEYNAVGLLMMKWDDGKTYSGSGALIDNRTVLTCGHNLVGQKGSKSAGHKATSIKFYPGWNDATRAPTGGVSASRFRFNQKYVDGEDAWDVGIVKLASSVDRSHYFVPQSVTDASLVWQYLKLTGYPGDKHDEQWEDTDQVAGIELTTNTMIFTHDTYDGSSGSPIYQYDPVFDMVRQYGIHNSRQGQGLKRGLLITQAVNNWIANMKFDLLAEESTDSEPDGAEQKRASKLKARLAAIRLASDPDKEYGGFDFAENLLVAKNADPSVLKQVQDAVQDFRFFWDEFTSKKATHEGELMGPKEETTFSTGQVVKRTDFTSQDEPGVADRAAVIQATIREMEKEVPVLGLIAHTSFAESTETTTDKFHIDLITNTMTNLLNNFPQTAIDAAKQLVSVAGSLLESNKAKSGKVNKVSYTSLNPMFDWDPFLEEVTVTLDILTYTFSDEEWKTITQKRGTTHEHDKIDTSYTMYTDRFSVDIVGLKAHYEGGPRTAAEVEARYQAAVSGNFAVSVPAHGASLKTLPPPQVPLGDASF